MYAPHTVSLINAVEESGVMQYHLTVLHGVMLQASKRKNVNKSGLSDADAVTLFVPFSVRALSPSGAVKRFASPKAYEAAESKDSLWTLKSGGQTSPVECFFVKGVLTEALSYTEAVKQYDDVFRATSVDVRDFGSGPLQHWQVGGR